MIEHKPTFCRICEPLCGMIATVEDGRLVSLRPDKEHPLSAGFACQKGIAFTEVNNDPDRVTQPLRRTAAGDSSRSAGSRRCRTSPRGSTPSSPNTARAPSAGTSAIRAPSATRILLWAVIFINGLGRGTHFFTASSQDTNARILASQLLYGTPTSMPIPDVARTDLLVVMGANPVVSHGSVLSVPRIKDRMHDIVKRGGRVVVIDPRRTETAAQFEWLGIIPDGDAYLLLSLLQVMFAEDLVDRAGVAARADGLDWLERRCAPFTPEVTRPHTGVEPDTVRGACPRSGPHAAGGRLRPARHQRRPERHADNVSDRCGQHRRGQRRSTGRHRCSARLGMPGQRWAMKAMGALLRRSYRRKRSRVGGFPRLIASEPAAHDGQGDHHAGHRQIKALFVSAGNPVLSVPNGDELEAAAEQLGLMVALDFYVTETTAHCDYILPVTTMYERDDFAITFQASRPPRSGRPPRRWWHRRARLARSGTSSTT